MEEGKKCGHLGGIGRKDVQAWGPSLPSAYLYMYPFTSAPAKHRDHAQTVGLVVKVQGKLNVAYCLTCLSCSPEVYVFPISYGLCSPGPTVLGTVPASCDGRTALGLFHNENQTRSTVMQELRIDVLFKGR